MLLTCPNCRSGLQVPDGTTAMVRCPACKTVFSAADSPPPEPEEEEEAAPEKPKVKIVVRKTPRTEDKPKPKDDEKKPENRDFDSETEEDERKRKKKRKRDTDDSMTPEEKKERKKAFERASIGVKLIWISFALFIFSMLMILSYFFQSAFAEPLPEILLVAGVLGVLNWLLAAIGVGLCLSGPRAPGHWGYGISAAVAVGVHLVFLLTLVAQGKEFGVAKADEEAGLARMAMVPTRLNATMYYLTAVFYPENQGITPPAKRMVGSMFCGIIEMTRTVLIMMLLSCMSRAALDEGLAHKCTRAAGIASGGPGLIGLLMVAFVAASIETNAGLNTFTQIVFATVSMGVYAIVIGTIFPAFMTAREVNDACDEPFQSLIPQL